MNSYKLVDLKREYDEIKHEIDPKITEIISKSEFILGSELADFEKEFAEFCGTRYCVGSSSGTAALFLSLKALGIGPGDEVITTSLTFTATAEAIVHAGAKPVFVDVEKDTMNIDAKQVEKKINERTKAVICVHLYGLPSNIDELATICRKNGINLIEDAAQAHGAFYKGKHVGSIGIIGCFSFMPAKNLGTYGDGGCIVTNDKKICDTIRLLRNHGRISKYEHATVGYSERLDNMLAAVLRIKLKYLTEWNKKRNHTAELYNSLLDSRCIATQKIPDGRVSSYYVFTILVKENRDSICKKLNEIGISTGIYYPKPLHLQDAYSHLGYKKGDMPVSEMLSQNVFSIPMHPFLSDEEVSYIAEKVNETVTEYSRQLDVVGV